MIFENTLKASPFLRWAGGKNWLVNSLRQYFPCDFSTYHEVFLGGGSVFFALSGNRESRLSDLNSELIEMYQVVRDCPSLLLEELSKFNNTKDSYYRVRLEKGGTEIQRAARFIFLNKSSFNGIYRVNSKGEFNVPYGKRNYKTVMEAQTLLAASAALKRTQLRSCDFYDTLEYIKKEDVVFIDPPYTVMHGDNGFVQYNQKIFSWEDQTRLASFIECVKQKGAYFFLTNADHPSIINLYGKSGTMHRLERHSLIGGKGARRKTITELLFTNYIISL